MITLQNLIDKTTIKISEYIEFDINELFQISDYITIYGGAVRDSIANLDINDIDILCMPKSAYKLRKLITEEYDYKYVELYDRSSLNMYKNISLISEPWTFINKNRKIIQIIRPRYFTKDISNDILSYKNCYLELLKNVDISSCGVFIEYINNKIILKESCKDAIIHCLTKKFKINKNFLLFNEDRIHFREYKLKDRGWLNIDSSYDTYDIFNLNYKSNAQIEREMKLVSLEFVPEYDYKIWNI